jgi:hypothetical protein
LVGLFRSHPSQSARWMGHSCIWGKSGKNAGVLRCAQNDTGFFRLRGREGRRRRFFPFDKLRVRMTWAFRLRGREGRRRGFFPFDKLRVRIDTGF